VETYPSASTCSELTPWLQRIHHADDLDFPEALNRIASASLNDALDLNAFPDDVWGIARVYGR
jgi:hypothetical protein